MNVEERIQALRALMEQKNIDAYYIPNEDDHLSAEYTADYYKCKSFITGFTGEAGCAVITKQQALLWTDGRYFTQAEIELEGSEVELMRMRQAGVPTVQEWLIDHVPENGVLGFDGTVVSAEECMRLAEGLKKKNASIHMKEDLAGLVWGEDRPKMPMDPIYILPEKYTGESADDRITILRNDMKDRGADAMVLTALEDPCWMLNIRGNDIAYTPVAYAFALVEENKCTYYINLDKVPAEVEEYLNKAGATIKKYEAIADDLSLMKKKIIWADLSSLNAMLYERLAGNDNRIINDVPTAAYYRGVKTPVEMDNIRHSHVKDGVAMTKFMYWIKTHLGQEMTEISAQNVLYALREEQEDYIEPSFETISAYGPNAAMMHYTASEKSNAKIENKGFLLVDSGGTYKDGTTDITRTFAMGELTEEEKKFYTLVLKGHVNLARQKFLQGTVGQNLDILARSALWNMGIDYQCGTGHGVGFVLSVHEGPHGISWGLRNNYRKFTPFVEGMVVTDEPGVYLPHKMGIRIENELLVVKDENNFYGQFLKFETLTFCPYDLDAIEPKYLNEDEIAWINEYHKNVYMTIAPYLNEEEKKWLKNATRELKKA